MVLSVLSGVLFGVLGPVIGFIIVAVKAQGRARSLGMLGFGLAGVIGVITQIASRLLPVMMIEMHLPNTLVTIVWGFGATILGLIPLIVLAVAIGANRSSAPVAGYPAPGGYGQYQAPRPGGERSGG